MPSGFLIVSKDIPFGYTGLGICQIIYFSAGQVEAKCSLVRATIDLSDELLCKEIYFCQYK